MIRPSVHSDTLGSHRLWLADADDRMNAATAELLAGGHPQLPGFEPEVSWRDRPQVAGRCAATDEPAGEV
jgi:hypothetical protein